MVYGMNDLYMNSAPVVGKKPHHCKRTHIAITTIVDAKKAKHY